MDGAQQLQGLLLVVDSMLEQCLFHRTALPESITRTAVPCCRYNGLVIADLAVLYDDVMRECTPRCFDQADTASLVRPGLRIPEFVVEGIKIAGLDIIDETVIPSTEGIGEQPGFQISGKGSAQC